MVSSDKTTLAPLKIAQVITRLNVGGPAVIAILLARELRDRGYPTLLLAGQVPPGERSMAYLADSCGVEPLPITAMSRSIAFLDDLQALYRLVRIFRRERPDIVHTHTAKAGTLGRVAAILAGVPIRVHTFHGHVFHGYFSPAVTRLFIAIERMLARKTDRIIAVSETQRAELADIYRIAESEKITAVNLGFDAKPFLDISCRSGQMRSAMGCLENQLLVGWAGRLTAIKNPALLVQTARIVASFQPHVRFAVIGEGELQHELQRQVDEDGLTDAVTLVGHRADMAEVYADLDLVLLTSRNEGTPMVLLEAMASGKPFVATGVGGIRDLMVGDFKQVGGFKVFANGILAPEDADVLADAVRFLAADAGLRASMGARGRKFVASAFMGSRLADDVERIYCEIARSRNLVSTRSAGCSVAMR